MKGKKCKHGLKGKTLPLGTDRQRGAVMKKKCRYLQQHHPSADFLSGDPVSIPLAEVVCGKLDEKRKACRRLRRKRKMRKRWMSTFNIIKITKILT